MGSPSASSKCPWRGVFNGRRNLRGELGLLSRDSVAEGSREKVFGGRDAFASQFASGNAGAAKNCGAEGKVKNIAAANMGRGEKGSRNWRSGP